MGKNHASQYANFGSLPDLRMVVKQNTFSSFRNSLKLLCRDLVSQQLIYLLRIYMPYGFGKLRRVLVP